MKKIIVILVALFFANLSYSQDIIKLVTGETIIANVNEIREDEIVYKSDASAPSMIMNISKIAFIELEADKMYFYNYDIKKHDVNTPELQQLEMNNPFELVKKGMNVFVPISSKAVAERAGKLRTRQILSEDGYWNVVETPYEAHFIFEFFIDDIGRDMAFFVIKSRNEKVLYTSERMETITNFNPKREGYETAEFLLPDLPYFSFIDNSKEYDINTPELQQLAKESPFEIIKKERNVFVPTSSENITERAGRLRIKQILSQKGYWNVVETPYEAHFIFEFFIDEKGIDRAYFVIKSRNGDMLYTSKRIRRISGSNKRSEGYKTAEALFEDEYDTQSEYNILLKLIERQIKKSNKRKS
ncbi:MAG: hypothetical protein LBE13_18465 [Bacteroidales bacterium]|jgi:hypothetical protein|nr:hypothetical protein [Bacteroidales bacterium]